MSTPYYIIDCFGPPASGKTTVTKLVQEQLVESGFQISAPTLSVNQLPDVRRKAVKSALATKSLVSSPDNSRQIIKLILDSNQTTKQDELRNILNWLFLQGLILNREQTVLLDQGYSEAISSVLLSAIDNFDYQLILEDVIRRTDEILFISIDADQDVIRSRLKDRAQNPSRVGRQFSVEDYFIVRAQFLEVIKRLETSNNSVRVLEITNNTCPELDKNVQLIVDQVTQKLS